MNLNKILFVDDEPNVLSAMQRQLRKQFNIETAPGPNEGLELLRKNSDFAVVVADMRMPEMNGVEFLAKVKEIAPQIVRLMLTGNVDQNTAIEAINEGSIFRFLNKPCSPERLVATLEAALRQYQLLSTERDLLENTLRGSVKVLADILSLTDPATFGHTEILRDHIRLVATHLKIENVWELEVAALLSRIGQVTIPPETTVKMRDNLPLESTETELLQQVPAIGSSLLAQIPRLESVSKIILHQSAHFDGSGFPEQKIDGEEIPLGARLLKVLADLSKLESEGNSRSASLDTLLLRNGWYDPQILDAVAACFKIYARCAPTKPPLAIFFNQLRVGHVLIGEIQTRDGIMIVGSGNRITPALIHRLRNFSSLTGIKEPIYVEAPI